MSSGSDFAKDSGTASAAFSKRKKEMENQTNLSVGYKRPRCEWVQTDDNVTMSLRLDSVQAEQLKKIDVDFTDTDVTVKLTDGRCWRWYFAEEVEREESRVKIKKHTVKLQMKKKEQKHWTEFEAPYTLTPPTADSQDEVELAPLASAESLSAPTDDVTPMPSSSAQSDDVILSMPILSLSGQSEDGITPMPSSSLSGQSEDGCSPRPSESFAMGSDLEDAKSLLEEKEEEPVCELPHVKHDFIEKDDTFTVHIYVKDILKDTVTVQFGQRFFRVKFQCCNADFLKLYSGKTSDTVFSWQVHLRGEIIPDLCRFKVSSYVLQIVLRKVVAPRWGDLEALKRKEPNKPVKSDNWIPLDKVRPRGQDEERVVEGQEKLNMGQDKDKENRRILERLSEKSDGERKEKTAETTEKVAQKPMCKVSPLNKPSVSDQVVSLGYTGLDNIGNTCFMNGVIQALANTTELRDFLTDGTFQKDINTENPLGSGGKLVTSFAFLLKILWSGKHYSYAPTKLKALVAMKASQFTGFAQHDAQEFLAFLLDGLHEDLNRIRDKPYTETVEDRGRPDEEVANEAWEVYKRRNDSFIVDHFQGQYKSKLVCPVCGKVSITFDPFLYLSLPLPKRQRLLPVIFMWKDPYRKPKRFMVRVAKEATVDILKELLSKKTHVNPADMRVFEAYKGRIHRLFSRGNDLSSVDANDTIIICEVLSEDVAGEPVYEIAVIQRTIMPHQFPSRCSYCKRLCPEGSKLKRCTKCFKVGYCDQSCQKNHWPVHKQSCRQTPEPVGCPFVISVPESRATFAQLCKLMEAYARYSVDVFQPPVKAQPVSNLTKSQSDCMGTDPAIKPAGNQSNTSSSGLVDTPIKLGNQSQAYTSGFNQSQASTSGLSSSLSNSSNSSQSSGSLNSLDSQSSNISSATITADQGQNLDDFDDSDGAGDKSDMSGTSLIPQVGSDSNMTSLSSQSDVAMDSGNSPISSSESTGFEVEAENNMVDQEKDQTSLSSDVSETVLSDVNKDVKGEKDGATTVNPVMGIQTEDTSRSLPLFYIKPVNQDGAGLTGAEGERLADKGDVPLDLSCRYYLSIDWKNNDKSPGYVLVQSKELESENDKSMHTASLEETNSVTLDQCLELFTEPEILAPEEAWYCPKCKAHREASKQMSVWKLPHTLIIQLKRFSFRNFIWRDKITKMVDFTIRGLDLSPYCVSTMNNSGPASLYDLYAVVNHHGGILGGHYTAYARCPETTDWRKNQVPWRLCDDSRVSTISHEKNVVTQGAYLLFYRRRESIVPPQIFPPSKTVQENLEEEEESVEDLEVPGASDLSQFTHKPHIHEATKLHVDSEGQDSDSSSDLPALESVVRGEDKNVSSYADDDDETFPFLDARPDNEVLGELGYTDMDSVD